MFKKTLITILLFFAFYLGIGNTYAARNCLRLGSSDYGTFKEYCYKITDTYMELRNKYEVNGKIDPYLAALIFKYSKSGLDYLPDSLGNKNYFNYLKTSIEKGLKYPNDPSVFSEIEKSVDNYLSKTYIQEVSGDISVTPKSGNAPLTVTLRGNVKDPSGTKLENYNYTWRVNNNGTRKIIGNNVFLRYTFLEEGNYSIFLDVTSNHRNTKGNTDVLTFSRRAEIEVKEKVASTIIRINGKSLSSVDEIKFSPRDSSYGLLIDATSSTPTSGTKFTKTKWDFGNGVEREYSGAPRIERVVYASNGTYEVNLEMKTNTGKSIKRDFYIIIRQPIATIKTNKTEGFLGDKFSFSAEPSYKDDNLSYTWEIIDLTKDKVIFNSTSSAFTYSFSGKGRYNVKLEITSPSGEKDYDNKIVYINSRAPFAVFSHSIPNSNKPNTIFLDASKSYDLDYSDEGKLEFNWIIDGDRVNLDNPNKDGSNGYYTFSSIGDHSVNLEVIDPDDITSQASKKVNVKSLLSLDFDIIPRVSQVGSLVKFIANSPNATFFEWSFGDGVVDGGDKDTMTHEYKESGIYNVSLKVGDKNDNENTFYKKLYVADANRPYAMVSIKTSGDDYGYEKGACNGKDAYIVNRVESVSFSAEDSIDVTGEKGGLMYSWKVGNNFYTTSNFSKKFDELGCVKVKLTVRSKKNNTSSVRETYVKVKNLIPKMSNLNIDVENIEADPVVVHLTAVGASDKDGVIQSYLWYYYTDAVSDPQDFRITKSNTTTFVLPKVTGTYYFVVVLKDNNEEKVSSEEISSRYFINVLGDNSNTPLVSLKVDDSSISVGDEVTFSANAENVQGFPINKDSKFYWDFDGDGFYDKETEVNNITYKYKKPGEFRPKVKVSHKGYSNSRSLTINVSNALVPDFDYISIGDKFIFFDNTKGVVSKLYWDMGDSNILEKKDSFTYNYKDDKDSHIVKLKAEDGTKVKEVEKKVIRNFRNYVDSRNKKLKIFSNHKIKDSIITLDKENEKLYFYLQSNLGNISNYVIDYDIKSDSDLNGGDDDDKDNKGDSSFLTGSPIKLELDEFKEQTCRLYLISDSGEILASNDIKIIKNYIKDKHGFSNKDLDGISEGVKNIFEKLSSLISDFPKKHKLKGLGYLQKLKDSWQDDREKISIILEFEGFVKESNVESSEEIVNLLEALIVEGEQDKSEKAITLKALKGLIPKSIVCNGDLSKEIVKGKTCYDLLISKLDNIAVSTDVESNKSLGEKILTVIASSEMTLKEKNDFKAILKPLVSNGLSNVSDEDIKEVKSDDKEKEKKKNNKNNKIIDENDIKETNDSGTNIFVMILYFFVGAIVLAALIVLAFFIWYKLKNKNPNKSFVDFVSEITNGKNTKEDLNLTENDNISVKDNDPLGDFSESDGEIKKDDLGETSGKKNNNIGEGKVPDWLKGNGDVKVKTEKKKQLDKSESIKEDKVSEKSEKLDTGNNEISKEKLTKKDDILDEKDKDLLTGSGVPDWLKGSLADGSRKQEDKDDLKQDKKTDSKVNDTEDKKEKNNKEEIKLHKSEVEKKEDLEKKTEIKTDEKQKELKSDKVLKQDKNEENKKDESLKLETKEDLEKATKLSIDDDDSIPDWLKGSLADGSKKQEDKDDLKQDKKTDSKVNDTEDKKEKNNKEEIKLHKSKVEKKEDLEKKTEIKTDEKQKKLKNDKVLKQDKNEENKKDEIEKEKDVSKATNKKDKKPAKISEKKSSKKDVENLQKKEKKDSKETKKDKKNENNDLWDDGMKIPDWLKTED